MTMNLSIISKYQVSVKPNETVAPDFLQIFYKGSNIAWNVL